MPSTKGSGTLHLLFAPPRNGSNLDLFQLDSSSSSVDNILLAGEVLIPPSQPKQGRASSTAIGADLSAASNQTGTGKVNVQAAKSGSDLEVPWEAAWAYDASSMEAVWNEHWSDNRDGAILHENDAVDSEEYEALAPSIFVEDENFNCSESSWSSDDDEETSNSRLEAKPLSADIMAPPLPPGRAAAAAWVAFRVRRRIRVTLRSFFLRWALEATHLDCTPAAYDDEEAHGCTSGAPNCQEVASKAGLEAERTAWDLEVDAEVLAMQREVATEFVRRLSRLMARLASRSAPFKCTTLATPTTATTTCGSKDMQTCRRALQQWQAATAAANLSTPASKASSGMESELDAAAAQLSDIAALIVRLESVGKANGDKDSGDSDEDEVKTGSSVKGRSSATMVEQQCRVSREKKVPQIQPSIPGSLVAATRISAKNMSGNVEWCDENKVENGAMDEQKERCEDVNPSGDTPTGAQSVVGVKPNSLGQENNDFTQSRARRVRFDETVDLQAESHNTIHAGKQRYDDSSTPALPQQSTNTSRTKIPSQVMAPRRSRSRAAWSAFDDDDEDVVEAGVAAAEKRLQSRQRAQSAAKRALINATEGAEAKAQREVEASRAEMARAEAAARVARRRREQVARAEAAKATALATEKAALMNQTSLSAGNDATSEADIDGASPLLHPHDDVDIASAGRQAAAQRVAAAATANKGMSAARAAALEILVAEHARDTAEHALKGAGPEGTAAHSAALSAMRAAQRRVASAQRAAMEASHAASSQASRAAEIEREMEAENAPINEAAAAAGRRLAAERVRQQRSTHSTAVAAPPPPPRSALDAHYQAAAASARDKAAQQRAGDQRARLMRRLAKAERLQKPEEAAQARALLRRASEMQQLYDQHFKQSNATRERLLANANAKDGDQKKSSSSSDRVISLAGSGSSVTDKRGQSSDRRSGIDGSSGPPLLLPSSGAGTKNDHSSSHRQGSKQSKSSNYPSLPPDKPAKLPNFPLLDVCTGQWRGLWDLFPGAIVVLEFYLSTSAPRSSGIDGNSGGPTVAVDP